MTKEASNPSFNKNKIIRKSVNISQNSTTNYTNTNILRNSMTKDQSGSALYRLFKDEINSIK